jgi:hypothetical protein
VDASFDADWYVKREGNAMIRPHGARALTGVLLVAGTALTAAPAAHAAPTAVQSALTAVTGGGVGKVVLSPTSEKLDTFVAQVKFNIHNAAPNTVFTITRAVDVPADGVCTSTTFGTVATLTTSAGGAGAVEVERSGPFPTFDLFVRVLGDDGSVLESGCMVIVAK